MILIIGGGIIGLSIAWRLIGIGKKVQGEVLSANDNFSARYDLDRLKGIFSRPQHKLVGKSYVDKILVLNIYIFRLMKYCNRANTAAR